jgi:PAS domain S-box-containing protein
MPDAATGGSEPIERVFADPVVRTLVEAAGAGVAVADASGICHVSPGLLALTGFTAAELLGRDLPSIAHTDFRNLVEERWRERLTAGGVAYRDRVRLEVAAGAAVWAEIVITRIDVAAKPYVLAIVFDITDRQRTEAALGAHRMEALGRLAGGIAHDFNNLLTVIGGHTERLVSALGQEAALGSSVVAIQQAARRAAALTQQLLAFSRRQVFHLQVLPLHQVVAGAKPLLAKALGAAIELRMDVPSDLPSIKADSSQVEQVLMGLAVHTREAMPGGGVLRIRMDSVTVGPSAPRERPWIRPGRYVRIQQTDSGPGMDAVTQARLFEPFFSTRHMGSGSGLGLATVYGIVKQSAGYIWVESEPGRGTTFTLLFPVLAEGDREVGAPGTSLAHETILVVDDDDNVRTLVADELRRKGYRVIDSSSGALAPDQAMLSAGRVHLLLTDVILRTGTGHELANRMKAADPLLQVLYMSGLPGSPADRRSMAGMPFIQKPFTLQALAGKVREVLDTGEGRG